MIKGEIERWLLLLFVVDERRLKDRESSWPRTLMIFGFSLFKLLHIGVGGLTIGAHCLEPFFSIVVSIISSYWIVVGRKQGAIWLC